MDWPPPDVPAPKLQLKFSKTRQYAGDHPTRCVRRINALAQ